MIHFMHLSNDELSKIFYIKPIKFDKNTDKQDLFYSMGATLKLPATKYIAPYLLEKRYTHLTSYVMSFECQDTDNQVTIAEKTVINTLRTLKMAENENRINSNDLPLFFIQVKSPEQFEKFYKTLNKENGILNYISGFFLPNFNSYNSTKYMEIIELLKEHHSHIYALPIIENKNLISISTRIDEMKILEDIISKYKDMILGVRINSSFFASSLGIKPFDIDSIHNVGITSSIIYDIINSINSFSYISIESSSWNKKSTSVSSFNHTYNKYNENKIISNIPFTHDVTLDGFIREVLLDKINRCIGKTVIYPNQISIVNALYSINRDEYEKAREIIDLQNNNTISNSLWAKKILSLSRIYGVLNDNYSANDLF